MDFRHLRAFVAVAEERNFTRAAQRLHISQPPLTRQIRQLEQDLGVTLFTRSRTGAEMTCEGAALLDAARAVGAAIGDFETAARALKERQTQTLHVGIGWGLWKAVNLIRERHTARFPHLAITAHDISEQQPASAIADTLDVAVMRTRLDDRLDCEPLFEERIVALLGDSHPLASRPSVRLAELVNEPLLLFDRAVGPSVYDKILALWEAARLKPLVVERQPPPYAQGATMRVASRQGYYLGIASPFTQTHEAGGVTVVPLDEPGARLDVLIAWHKHDSSMLVRDFVRSAREVFPPPDRVKAAPTAERPLRQTRRAR